MNFPHKRFPYHTEFVSWPEDYFKAITETNLIIFHRGGGGVKGFHGKLHLNNKFCLAPSLRTIINLPSFVITGDLKDLQQTDSAALSIFTQFPH